MIPPTFTQHARKRFAERFPHLVAIEREWAMTRWLTKEEKKRLSNRVKSKIFDGFYVRISKQGVVFVIAQPKLVITVYPLT